jgi:hypothetical protein
MQRVVDLAGATMADTEIELEKMKFEFEKQKWEFEKAKWEDDKLSRARELTLKEREVDANIRAQGFFHIFTPLAAAVAAALLAGAGSAIVAWETASSQYKLETTKADRQDQLEKTKEADSHKLEQEKADATHNLELERFQATRILGAIKDDPDVTSANLQFLLDIGLIKDEVVRINVKNYRSTRLGGTGAGGVASAPATEPKNPPQPESQAKQDTILYQSGWVGGGHSQNEMCQKGIASLQPQHPGKTLSLVSSDEQFRKDFLGHVEYNYSCVFRVS